MGYDFITDMLVLEFALDTQQIDTYRADNWLNRAAQSLAEALRLAASKELDVEFTELVTVFRLRNNSNGFFVDLYLYDNLSSGAGYAVAVSKEIGTLLKETETILKSCSCESVCHSCLKHYRNQFVHGMLDRFAALDLLNWGVHGQLAPKLPLEMQKDYLNPLCRILEDSGYTIRVESTGIIISNQYQKQKVIIYPAMWVEPSNVGEIYLSDAGLKYAKPYALQKIIDSF